MATSWRGAARHGWLLAAALTTSCAETDNKAQPQADPPLAQRSCELPCGRGVQRCNEDGTQCTECLCVLPSDATILPADADFYAGAGGGTAPGGARAGAGGSTATDARGGASAGRQAANATAGSGGQGGWNTAGAGCADGGSAC